MNSMVLNLYKQIRLARRQRGMTQSQLAREVHCSQSAISMYESGHLDALADKTVKLIADLMGLEIPDDASSDAAGEPVALASRKYCPVDDCPSNIPYVAGGGLHFKPTLVEGPVNEPSHCGFCGEVLESACPQDGCGAPLNEGGVCERCGVSYVPVTRMMRGSLDEWVARRREQIGELWTMSRTRKFGA
jgi:DNA-binding XRE family transcriptional regulator